MVHAEGFIRIYRFGDNGRQLELVHRTAVGGVPGALAAFRGRLLAGVGASLRIYEAGKKKLLRKCEHRKLPTHIATLAVAGARIFVGDLQVRAQRMPPPCACMFSCMHACIHGVGASSTCRRARGAWPPCACMLLCMDASPKCTRLILAHACIPRADTPTSFCMHACLPLRWTCLHPRACMHLLKWTDVLGE
jgi:hypothetical protein